MLFHQTVKDPRLRGNTRHAAELKGDLPVDPPLHGFDHIGVFSEAVRSEARSLNMIRTLGNGIGGLSH